VVIGTEQVDEAVGGAELHVVVIGAVCTPSVSRSVRLFTNTKCRAAAAVGATIRRGPERSRGIVVGRADRGTSCAWHRRDVKSRAEPAHIDRTPGESALGDRGSSRTRSAKCRAKCSRASNDGRLDQPADRSSSGPRARSDVMGINPTLLLILWRGPESRRWPGPADEARARCRSRPARGRGPDCKRPAWPA